MTTNAQAIHATLQGIFNELFRVSLDKNGLSVDTIFALGEALGVVSKAKALVGRDIDDAQRRPASEETRT